MDSMQWILSLLLIQTLSNNQTVNCSTQIDKWMKFACTPENIKSIGTYFCDKDGNIQCLPGWKDERSLCRTPVCGINDLDCLHGNCSKPFTCQCEIGWTGRFCERCLTTPGCVNGYCKRSFECICNPGWHGMLCDRPVCENCLHGDCVMPGMCLCHEGWNGPNCTTCEQRADCSYGRCIGEPFECVCYDGFDGSACDEPICKQGCHKNQGFCRLPDTCWCKEGWTGENCTDCIPRKHCEHGTCDKPWECKCEPGYFGHFCNETQNIDGHWGEWGQWSCSVTCGNGQKTRKRFCNNPSKSGNGKYCSSDGTSSTESGSCNLLECPNGYGPWGAWSLCSEKCLGKRGTQKRTRTCNLSLPGIGANQCDPKLATEERICEGIIPYQLEDPQIDCYGRDGAVL